MLRDRPYPCSTAARRNGDGTTATTVWLVTRASSAAAMYCSRNFRGIGLPVFGYRPLTGGIGGSTFFGITVM